MSIHHDTPSPLRSHFVRGLALGSGIALGFSLIGLTAISFASGASSGGAFGAALNQILASNDWTSPNDGTVKNAQTLGGSGAANYLKFKGNGCDAGYAIYKIDPDGAVHCTPISVLP